MRSQSTALTYSGYVGAIDCDLLFYVNSSATDTHYVLRSKSTQHNFKATKYDEL